MTKHSYMKKGCILLMIMCISVPTSSLANSDSKPKQVGKFNYWRAFVIGTDATKTCYIISEPISKKPSGINRGDVYLSITHRPGQNIRNEISMRIGYPFSQKSYPFAQIGKDKFSFFTGASANFSKASKFWAWLENANKQDSMVQAMKRGNRLVFKGTSSRSTVTTDTYSLSGFTAAMKHINTACPK